MAILQANASLQAPMCIWPRALILPESCLPKKYTCAYILRLFTIWAFEKVPNRCALIINGTIAKHQFFKYPYGQSTFALAAAITGIGTAKGTRHRQAFHILSMSLINFRGTIMRKRKFRLQTQP